MNYWLLIFFTSLLSSGFSQVDTTCIQTRWISVKNSAENQVLFAPSASIMRTIRKPAHEHKVRPFHSNCSFQRYQPSTPSPLIKIDSNFITYEDYLDTSNHIITIYAQSDVCFVDEYGEPLTRTEADGSITILYEEPEVFRINLDELVEIRIREDRNEEGEFAPTKIGFYIKDEYDILEELFWIDLARLMKDIQSTKEYPWYSFLENREYVCFQYKQVSCYDNTIR